MKNLKIYFFTLVVLSVIACRPDRDDDITLGDAPALPTFSLEPVAGDSNRWVVKDLTPSAFQRLWDFQGGNPKNSADALDTVYFAKKGTYNITLYTSLSDGSGTSNLTKKITILNDGVPDCTPQTALLTGDCGTPGKGWTLSHDAGAVKVGPTYDDYSWFTSTANSLQDAQYDDRFWFAFDGQQFENRNNGASVNPWNGYSVEPHAPGVSEFLFLEGTGINGADQILLPDDQFMGVWDCDNLMTIIKLTATELIVRARIRNQAGVPNAEGWFELHFEAN